MVPKADRLSQQINDISLHFFFLSRRQEFQDLCTEHKDQPLQQDDLLTLLSTDEERQLQMHPFPLPPSSTQAAPRQGLSFMHTQQPQCTAAHLQSGERLSFRGISSGIQEVCVRHHPLPSSPAGIPSSPWVKALHQQMLQRSHRTSDFTALAACHEQEDETLQERYSFCNPFNASNAVNGKTKKTWSAVGLLKFKECTLDMLNKARCLYFKGNSP